MKRKWSKAARAAFGEAMKKSHADRKQRQEAIARYAPVRATKTEPRSEAAVPLTPAPEYVIFAGNLYGLVHGLPRLYAIGTRS